MALLDSSKMAEMESFARNLDQGGQEPQVDNTADRDSQEPLEASQVQEHQPEPEAKREASSKGDYIPKARFSEVVAQRRKLQEDNERLNAELKAARSTRTEAPAARQQDVWLDEVLSETQNTRQPSRQDSGVLDRAAQYEERIAQLELRNAVAEVDHIVAQAKRDFPEVPADKMEKLTLLAIRSGGDANDAFAMWEEFSHGTAPSQTVSKASVPPTHGAKPTGTGNAAAPKPKTMEDAHQAMRSWLQANRGR